MHLRLTDHQAHQGQIAKDGKGSVGEIEADEALE